MKQVLTTIESEDQSALTQLAISKAEFKKYRWPTITSVGDSTTADLFYQQFEKGSQLGIAERLRDFAGQELKLVKVAFGTGAKKAKVSACCMIPRTPFAIQVGKRRRCASLPAYWSQQTGTRSAEL